MKTLLKTTLFLLLILCTHFVAQSQDLRKLSAKKRNAILIEKSKEAILKYGEVGYYNACLTPKISSFIWPLDDKNKGRLIYKVVFPYDTTKIVLGTNYAAKVRIWADSGRVYSVGYGNTLGYGVEQLENEGKQVPKIIFEYRTREELDRENREWHQRMQSR